MALSSAFITISKIYWEESLSNDSILCKRYSVDVPVKLNVSEISMRC